MGVHLYDGEQWQEIIQPQTVEQPTSVWEFKSRPLVSEAGYAYGNLSRTLPQNTHTYVTPTITDHDGLVTVGGAYNHILYLNKPGYWVIDMVQWWSTWTGVQRNFVEINTRPQYGGTISSHRNFVTIGDQGSTASAMTPVYPEQVGEVEMRAYQTFTASLTVTGTWAARCVGPMEWGL